METEALSALSSLSGPGLYCFKGAEGVSIGFQGNRHLQAHGVRTALKSVRKFTETRRRAELVIRGAQSSPKGFGPKPVPSKSPKSPNPKPGGSSPDNAPFTPTLMPRQKAGEEEEEEEEEYGSSDEGVPEVVTNRMLKRMLFTVGMPLALGILYFPLFYWLKVVQKVEIPEWLPLIASLFTFGTAGLGISYGVLSASWDPSREGTLLGWKEARANWPVLWQNLKGPRV